LSVSDAVIARSREPRSADTVNSSLADAIPPGTTAIRLADVSKAYPRGPKVLRNISLRIGEGEVVALIGSNGSGKSTLLKCIAGVHPIDSGTAEVFGERFGPDAKPQTLAGIRRHIGFVFQHHALVRRLSVLSNVVHGRLGDGGSWRAFHQMIAPDGMRREAMEALRMVGLEEKAQARADALSGGQAQRVAIARALIRKPRLLIADEPAASLDPVAGQDVMQAFVDIAGADGTTLVFTTHDLEHALQFGRRVVALRQGAIVLDRPADTLTRAELSEIYE
jgi:phosphonate transport system ATP-binding protein